MKSFVLFVGAAANIWVATLPPFDVLSVLNIIVAILCILVAILFLGE